MTDTPTAVDIITYQVGFGDCFLLRFRYPDRQRQRCVLIDFGSTRAAKGVTLEHVADQIAQDCKGKLDVVVATHRHKDHVHGFAPGKGKGKRKGTGDTIAALSPSVVILPWTEDPKAKPNAKRPTTVYGSHAARHVGALDDMQRLAGAIASQSKLHRFESEKHLRPQLAALGENNLGNAAAMKNLREMATRTRYAYYGMNLALAKVLPGVRVRVLGPPTLDQSDAITKQRSRSDEEFWHLQAHSAVTAIDDPLIFPDAKLAPRDPIWARWLRRRLRVARGEQLLSIVRSLDHAMNNTSLILLFEVGRKKLLFPGDAQFENWQHALDKPGVRKLLAGIDLYKVGHHGSLNATPMTMFEAFTKRRSKGKKKVMHSLLSTLPDVHGSVESRTEVPRASLVKELEDDTDLLDTTGFGVGEVSRVVTLKL